MEDVHFILMFDLRTVVSIVFFFFPASSFNSHYFLLFLKSSRSCVLLPTPFTSVICSWKSSWRMQYFHRIWLTRHTFLLWISFRSALFSPIRSRNAWFVTFSHYFTFSIPICKNVSFSTSLLDRLSQYGGNEVYKGHV